MDRLTPEARSRLMSRIRARDTSPELRVRSLLHSMGCRFRLHARDLPGTPDIVMPARGAVVFVNGCFWHGHHCKVGRMPKSRIDYWGPKIEANQRRDRRKTRLLRTLGWRVITVWECELKDTPRLQRRLARYFEL